MKREKKIRIAISAVIGVMIAVFLTVAYWHYSAPIKDELEIWLPEETTVESALEIYLSGTALTIPFEQFKERFGEGSALVVVQPAGEVHYIAKEEGLTFVSAQSFSKKENIWRIPSNAKITGGRIQIDYQRGAVPMGTIMPALLVFTSILIGMMWGNAKVRDINAKGIESER